MHGDHWVTISNLKCDASKIIVYDSFYVDVDQEVEDLIRKMFDSEIEIVMSKEMPKQKVVLIAEGMPLPLPQHSCMAPK